MFWKIYSVALLAVVVAGGWFGLERAEAISKEVSSRMDYAKAVTQVPAVVSHCVQKDMQVYLRLKQSPHLVSGRVWFVGDECVAICSSTSEGIWTSIVPWSGILEIYY